MRTRITVYKKLYRTYEEDFLMQYGHFDLAAKEYVITRPDTPAPWCNYLGSPAYGAIISNNAGGYSFVKSGSFTKDNFEFLFQFKDVTSRTFYLYQRQ